MTDVLTAEERAALEGLEHEMLCSANLLRPGVCNCNRRIVCATVERLVQENERLHQSDADSERWEKLARERGGKLDETEALARELVQALEAVLFDAGLEDEYESRESDGRFISKTSLLKARAALLKEMP
jgi:hypothetical protein